MPREFSRSQRMAEQLRRELSEIVREEVKDPRLGLVSFTEIRLSRDLSHALIFTSVLDADQQQESIKVLNSAAGFIRKQVAQRIRTRVVPSIRFVLDDSVARGAAMDELISEAIASDDRKHAVGDDAEHDDDKDK